MASWNWIVSEMFHDIHRVYQADKETYLIQQCLAHCLRPGVPSWVIHISLFAISEAGARSEVWFCCARAGLRHLWGYARRSCAEDGVISAAHWQHARDRQRIRWRSNALANPRQGASGNPRQGVGPRHSVEEGRVCFLSPLHRSLGHSSYRDRADLRPNRHVSASCTMRGRCSCAEHTVEGGGLTCCCPNCRFPFEVANMAFMFYLTSAQWCEVWSYQIMKVQFFVSLSPCKPLICAGIGDIKGKRSHAEYLTLLSLSYCHQCCH